MTGPVRNRLGALAVTVALLLAVVGCSAERDTTSIDGALSGSPTTELSDASGQVVPEIPTENAPPVGKPPILRAPEVGAFAQQSAPSVPRTSAPVTTSTTSVDSKAAKALVGLDSADDRALAASALSLVGWDWRGRLPGWEIRFLPGRSGYRGSTFPDAKVIEIYVRGGESPESLAHVIAHEMGHAIDTQYLTDVQRQAWRTVRGIPAEVPWWPGSGAADYSTGAGDWAESFAYVQTHHDWFSQLGGAPDAVQTALVKRFAKA
ncbi:MAG: hypothetical protein ACHQDC_07905 [Acidimicrobiales bacterium]|jgi:hypothetical protein